jgi:hypothetical protein
MIEADIILSIPVLREDHNMTIKASDDAEFRQCVKECTTFDVESKRPAKMPASLTFNTPTGVIVLHGTFAGNIFTKESHEEHPI